MNTHHSWQVLRRDSKKVSFFSLSMIEMQSLSHHHDDKYDDNDDDNDDDDDDDDDNNDDNNNNDDDDDKKEPCSWLRPLLAFHHPSKYCPHLNLNLDVKDFRC